jgi:hypothetical protein
MNLPQFEGRQAIEPRHPSRSLPTRRHYSMRSLFLAGVLLAASWVLVGGAAEQSPAPGVAADQLGGLQYRFIGPPGNRLSAVIGVPGDPSAARPAACGNPPTAARAGSRWPTE